MPASAATNHLLSAACCRLLPACLQVDEEKECLPSDCFEGVDYDREEHGGYTGNEGATLDRWVGGGLGCFEVAFFVACMWM